MTVCPARPVAARRARPLLTTVIVLAWLAWPALAEAPAAGAGMAAPPARAACPALVAVAPNDWIAIPAPEDTAPVAGGTTGAAPRPRPLGHAPFEAACDAVDMPMLVDLVQIVREVVASDLALVEILACDWRTAAESTVVARTAALSASVADAARLSLVIDPEGAESPVIVIVPRRSEPTIAASFLAPPVVAMTSNTDASMRSLFRGLAMALLVSIALIPFVCAAVARWLTDPRPARIGRTRLIVRPT